MAKLRCAYCGNEFKSTLERCPTCKALNGVWNNGYNANEVVHETVSAQPIKSKRSAHININASNSVESANVSLEMKRLHTGFPNATSTWAKSLIDTIVPVLKRRSKRNNRTEQTVMRKFKDENVETNDESILDCSQEEASILYEHGKKLHKFVNINWWILWTKMVSIPLLFIVMEIEQEQNLIWPAMIFVGLTVIVKLFASIGMLASLFTLVFSCAKTLQYSQSQLKKDVFKEVRTLFMLLIVNFIVSIAIKI